MMDSNTSPLSHTPIEQAVNQTNKPPKQNNPLPLIFLLIIIIVLLFGGVYFFITRDTSSQNSDIPEVSPTEVVEELTPTDPLAQTRNLYTVINCTIYKATLEGEFEKIKEDPRLCNGNGFINHENNLVTSYGTTEENFTSYITNLSSGEIYENDDLGFVNNLSKDSNVLYRDIDFSIYKGTLENRGNKIYSYEPGGGRGIASDDDFALRLSPDETKIIFQRSDTLFKLTEENANSLYASSGAVVLSDTGRVILEIPGARKSLFVDDNTVLTVVYSENEDEEIVKILRRYILEENRYTYVDLARIDSDLDIYSMDYLFGTALINTIDNSTYVSYTADITGDSTTLFKLDFQTADNHFLNETTIIGNSFEPCTGDIENNAPLPCPIDAPFSEYLTAVVRHNLETNTSEKVINSKVLINKFY